MDHQHGLDLGVVVRVVAREQGDGLPVVEAEARRRIGDSLPDDPRQEEGEEMDARAPADRSLVPEVLQEA